MRKIDFFYMSSGYCPVEEFLDALTPKQAQKVTWVMKLVEELEKVPEQYFKKLVNTEGIWEIRVQLGSNIFRILGFFKDSKHFIATNGFQKKTQKTPLSEIKLSEKRKLEYFTIER
jgi:phage-related protein